MNGDSLWSVSLLLSIVLEGTDKLWDIVVISLGGLLAGSSKISDLGFQEVVLLWSHLLEDIWQHILKVLGLSGSGNNEKVFSHRELG